MGAVRWGRGSPCGVPSPPRALELEGAGAAGARVLTSWCRAGAPPAGAADWRSAAHTPPADPSQPGVLGATVAAALAHACLSPPPRAHLEGAAATSTFPLRFLASAARGVPGGLIKFDLFFFFFFRQSLTPTTTSAPRGLPFPSSPASGSLSGCPPSPAWPRGVQSRGGRWGCSSSCQVWEAGVPGACLDALWPQIHPRSSAPSLPPLCFPRARG